MQIHNKSKRRKIVLLLAVGQKEKDEKPFCYPIGHIYILEKRKTNIVNCTRKHVPTFIGPENN